MVVVKSEDGDVISVVDKVHEAIREFEKGLPAGVEIILTNDFSYYVKRRLSTLVNNGMTGFILVVLILFIFMEPVSAFLTAWGLPFSVFATFFFMYCFGISINIVSMLGLIIVVGMLVDDAIIISENVYRYLEEGLDLKEAVIRGTQEVVVPVMGTIITTCVAFMPLLFMQDIIGKFIREIPWVVMIALLSSLVEAFFILPSHLYDFLSFKFRKWPQSAFTHRQKTKAQHRFRAFQKHYVKFIDWVLTHRGKSVLVMFLILAGAVYLWKFHMKTILFTGEGIEQFYIRGEAAKGTPVETMEKLMIPVEKLVAALPQNEVESFRSYIGSVEEGHGFDPAARRAGHLGQITVFLTPIRGRDRSAGEIANSLRARFAEVQGLEKLYVYVPKEGPPVGRDIEIGIKGEHPEVMQKIAGQFIEKLKAAPGVSDIENSYQFGKRQLRVIVDENKARQSYLTIQTVAQTVRQAIKGGVATTVKPDKAEEEIDVLVRFPQEARKNAEVLKSVLVPNTRGNLIPLTSVAKIVEEDGVYVIRHLDGKRVIYVQASLDSEVTTAFDVNHMLQKEFKDIENIHQGYTVKYSGEFEEQMKSQRGLFIAFLVAVGLIFIILAAQFDSVIQPFIVMLAIPFGLAGVIFSFFLHGKPISFFALMGVVGLAGVVVNDSIVLVDFINYLRKKGKPLRICLVQAGKMRLRAVFMTSVTTVGGMVSLAYGLGGSDPFLKPLGLSMMWGLAFSTTMVLIIIPCVYSIVDEWSVRILGRAIVRMEP
jgi:multidrug efflux pump subunit AcrB